MDKIEWMFIFFAVIGGLSGIISTIIHFSHRKTNKHK